MFCSHDISQVYFKIPYIVWSISSLYWRLHPHFAASKVRCASDKNTSCSGGRMEISVANSLKSLCDSLVLKWFVAVCLVSDRSNIFLKVMKYKEQIGNLLNFSFPLSLFVSGNQLSSLLMFMKQAKLIKMSEVKNGKVLVWLFIMKDVF